MRSESPREVALRYFEALAARDLDAIVGHWQPGAVDHLAGERLQAPEGVCAYFRELFEAFPDLVMSPLTVVAEGEHCAVRWRARGRFLGPGRFQGLLPNGRPLAFEGVDLFCIRDGRIAGNHAYVDGLDVGRQLGLLPPAKSAAEGFMIALKNLGTRLRRRGALRRLGLAVIGVSILVLAACGGSSSLDPALSDAPSETRPITALEIRRDAYGVPHVFAPDLVSAARGVGQALAEDRLFQMELIRRAAKGTLSELLGPLTLSADQAARLLASTEAERRERLERYPAFVRERLQAYVQGVNDHIERARGLEQLPVEFALFALVPEPWTVTDVMAVQDLLLRENAAGGGVQLQHLALLRALQARHGEITGQAMFDDLILPFDPDAPTVVPEALDWRRSDNRIRRNEVESRRRLNEDARRNPSPAAVSADAALTTPRIGTRAQAQLVPDPQRLLPALEAVQAGLSLLEGFFPRGGSFAQVVAPQRSASGGALLTAGPQIGWAVPSFGAEIGIHTPELDVVGFTLPGSGPAVLIGLTAFHSWTQTTGFGPAVDLYVVETDPDDPERYRHRGAWETMDCRDEEYRLRGVVPINSQRVCRTRQGPVIARDAEAHLAFAQRSTVFNRQQQDVETFSRLAEARSLEDFASLAHYAAGSHSFFYADRNGDIAYWQTGNYPVRPAGTDLRLPQDGSGGAEWQGLIPAQALPHAINPEKGYLVGWNNSMAFHWPIEASRARFDFRAFNLERSLAADAAAVPDPLGAPFDNRRVSARSLHASARHGAYIDYTHDRFVDLLPESEPDDPALRDALARARGWNGLLEDRDNDDRVDDPGATIFMAWLDALVASVLDGRLDALPDIPLDFDPVRGERGFYTRARLVWHLLAENSRLPLHHDWLQGRDPAVLRAEALAVAVRALQARFESDDPDTWLTAVPQRRFQRLNADLLRDAAVNELPAELREALPRLGLGILGDVPEVPLINTAPYLHVVDFGAPEDNGSWLPPGQSGYIDLLGRESPHYRDQLPLLLTGCLKPLPLTRGAFEAAAAQRGRRLCP